MSGEAQYIQELETPAVILDISRLESNINRFQDIADREKVELWPHVKSTKCRQIWEMQAGYGAKGFVAATLKEAENVMNIRNGQESLNNVLLAYPHVDPHALARIEQLMQRQGAKVGLLVANDEGADIVHQHFKDSGSPEIYLAIDTGLHREGIDPRGKDAMRTVKHLQDLFGEKLVGISTHAGHVYRKNKPEKAKRIAVSERDQMLEFAERCKREAGVDFREIGLGSTPTVNFFKNRTFGESSITQVHPGNYAFMDNLQVGLGVAKPGECALSVMATVVDKRTIKEKLPGKKSYRERGLLITDAGSKTLSSDSKPHGLTGASIYGMVYEDMDAQELLEDGVCVAALSEEHGKITVPKRMLDQPIAEIGHRLRLLVQHACPVVNLAGAQGICIVEGDRVIDIWPIIATGH